MSQAQVQDYFANKYTFLLKHKMLQFVFKISPYMAATCFGPFGPSSGSIQWNLARMLPDDDPKGPKHVGAIVLYLSKCPVKQQLKSESCLPPLCFDIQRYCIYMSYTFLFRLEK